MAIIYHIATLTDWDAAHVNGFYEAASLNNKGFIHCSEERQVIDVYNRFFEDQTDVVKLIIDTDKLASMLVYEWSPDFADTFPHVYGRINLDAVVGTEFLASSF